MPQWFIWWTSVAWAAAAPIEFKVAGETLVAPASCEARIVPENDPWRVAFESEARALRPEWRPPDVYLEVAGKADGARPLLLIKALPLGVEGLKTYHDTDAFRQLFPADGKALRVDSKDERYVVYLGRREEDDLLFAVALCRGKVFHLELLTIDESWKVAARDRNDGLRLRQVTRSFVQANPVAGANQINTNLMSLVALVFILLGALLHDLQRRRRIKAERATGAG